MLLTDKHYVPLWAYLQLEYLFACRRRSSRSSAIAEKLRVSYACLSLRHAQWLCGQWPDCFAIGEVNYTPLGSRRCLSAEAAMSRAWLATDGGDRRRDAH